MKYFIGEKGFKTKKECETFTREYINKIGCGKVSDSTFLHDLLQNHPNCDEKKGVGIDYFYIIPNPITGTSLQTMIYRLDGSSIDFSWKNCTQFRSKTPQIKLLEAMRTSIIPDIIFFRQNNSKICSICQKKDGKFHVDHDSPSFKGLSTSFLQNKTIPTTFTGDILTRFKDEDILFEKEWIDYHTTNCNLQILCENCNLKKIKT